MTRSFKSHPCFTAIVAMLDLILGALIKDSLTSKQYLPITGWSELKAGPNSKWADTPSKDTLQKAISSIKAFLAYICYVTGWDPDIAMLLDGGLVKRYLQYLSQLPATMKKQKSTIQTCARGLIRGMIYLAVSRFKGPGKEEQHREIEALAAATMTFANSMEEKEKLFRYPRAMGCSVDGTELYKTEMPLENAALPDTVIELAQAINNNILVLVEALLTLALATQEMDTIRLAVILGWLYCAPLLTGYGGDHPGTLRSEAVAWIQVPPPPPPAEGQSAAAKGEAKLCLYPSCKVHNCQGNRLFQLKEGGKWHVQIVHSKQAALMRGVCVLLLQVNLLSLLWQVTQLYLEKVRPQLLQKNPIFTKPSKKKKKQAILNKHNNLFLMTSEGNCIDENTSYEVDRGVAKAAKFLSQPDAPAALKARLTKVTLELEGGRVVEGFPYCTTRQWRNSKFTLHAAGKDPKTGDLTNQQLAALSLTSVDKMASHYVKYDWLAHVMAPTYTNTPNQQKKIDAGPITTQAAATQTDDEPVASSNTSQQAATDSATQTESSTSQSVGTQVKLPSFKPRSRSREVQTEETVPMLEPLTDEKIYQLYKHLTQGVVCRATGYTASYSNFFLRRTLKVGVKAAATAVRQLAPCIQAKLSLPPPPSTEASQQQQHGPSSSSSSQSKDQQAPGAQGEQQQPEPQQLPESTTAALLLEHSASPSSSVVPPVMQAAEVGGAGPSATPIQQQQMEQEHASSIKDVHASLQGLLDTLRLRLKRRRSSDGGGDEGDGGVEGQ